MSEQLTRIDRYAERDWVEWMSAEVLPERPMWAIVRDEAAGQKPTLRGMASQAEEAGTGIKRVLFTGRYWMTRDSFKSWRPCPESERAVTALVAASAERKPTPIDGLELLEVEVEQGDEVKTLAELARLELNVEVVRLYKPGQESMGAVSGRVLAVSKSYAAQSIGGNGVLIHEQSKLDRRLQPGEQVTVNYEAGKGKVFNGAFFDVNVRSSFLSQIQIGWLRMKMIEALSSVEGADQDDEMITAALKYALDQTADQFEMIRGELPRSAIEVAVRDIMPAAQIEVANRTGQYVDRAEDVAVQDRFERYSN